jgi:L-aspartate oxidase
VFSRRAFEHVRAGRSFPGDELPPVPAWDDSGTFDAEEWVLVGHDRREIQQIMWDYVGIVRSDHRLDRAERRLALIASEVESFYKRTKVTEGLIELRNLAAVAQLIVKSALRRKESRGLHYTTDYPATNDAEWRTDTVISLQKV